MTGARTLMMAALVALLQIGFLGWMIQGRASILQNGREVLLRVRPIDPRDLLRGDYVVMDYEAGQVPASLVPNVPTGGMGAYGRNILVRLAKQPDGYWMPISAALVGGAQTAAAPDQVDISGRVIGETSTDGNARVLLVDFGIGRFYVPEGEGLAIQEDLRERPFGILAAVDGSGMAQIKGLMDEGKMLYEEPPY